MTPIGIYFKDIRSVTPNLSSIKLGNINVYGNFLPYKDVAKFLSQQTDMRGMALENDHAYFFCSESAYKNGNASLFTMVNGTIREIKEGTSLSYLRPYLPMSVLYDIDENTKEKKEKYMALELTIRFDDITAPFTIFIKRGRSMRVAKVVQYTINNDIIAAVRPNFSMSDAQYKLFDSDTLECIESPEGFVYTGVLAVMNDYVIFVRNSEEKDISIADILDKHGNRIQNSARILYCSDELVTDLPNSDYYGIFHDSTVRKPYDMFVIPFKTDKESGKRYCHIVMDNGKWYLGEYLTNTYTNAEILIRDRKDLNGNQCDIQIGPYNGYIPFIYCVYNNKSVSYTGSLRYLLSK